MKKICSFILAVLITAGTGATSVSALPIDIDEIKTINKTWKSDSDKKFCVYEDKCNLFCNDNNNYSAGEYAVLLNEKFFREVYIVHKTNSSIVIRFDDISSYEEIESVINDVLASEGISADKINISEPYNNYKINISSADDNDYLIKKDIAQKLCDALTDKDLIGYFLFNDSGYMADETEFTNELRIPVKEDAEKIKSVLKENGFNNVKLTSCFSDVYSMECDSSVTILQYLEICELINSEAQAKPIFLDCMSVPFGNDKYSGVLYIKDSLSGDIDGDGVVSVSDLSVLSLILTGDKDGNEFQKKAADVDKDGKVTLADLARMRQYLSKIIEAF